MAGGLIQVVVYGSQDLFLTGTPEITFFKVVYRRHTHFSMESVRVPFDDEVGFDKIPSLTVHRNGDLMFKTYLEIEIPEIRLLRRDPTDDGDIETNIYYGEPNRTEDLEAEPPIVYWDREVLQTNINNTDPTSCLIKAYELDLAKVEYNIVTRNFAELTRSCLAATFESVEAENGPDVVTMDSNIGMKFTDASADIVDPFIVMMQDALNNYDPVPPYTYNEISLTVVSGNYVTSGQTDRDLYFEWLSLAAMRFIEVQEYFYQRLLDAKEVREDCINPYIKFAWVDKLGHAIIDYIEVMIGGHTIDKHYGDWINIWHELSHTDDLELTYYKLIGNVESLTTFDRNAKPAYKIRLPLQFWFCRHSGLALPLVSLQYHCVTFLVKFRKIEELSYIEEGETIFVPRFNEGIFLDEVPEELNIDISATMLIDYVYLDSPERRRFAQSSHEYLIDQTQILEIENIEQNRLRCILNNFNHPTIELIWVAQKREYTENFEGSRQLRWDNYSISDDNIGNIISYSTIDFHSYERVLRLPGNYFNYVQPWENHTTTPSDGINVYSFSLHPEDNQPSGSANMSRLTRVALLLEFDARLFPEDEDPVPINIRIYTRNYNILRFISGMGGTAYTYG